MYASFVGSDSAGATYSSRLLAIRNRPCKTPSACVTGEVMNFSDSNSGAGYVQTQYHALRYSGNGPSIQAAPCLGSPTRFYSYASHVGRRSWRRRRPRGHHADACGLQRKRKSLRDHLRGRVGIGALAPHRSHSCCRETSMARTRFASASAAYDRHRTRVCHDHSAKGTNSSAIGRWRRPARHWPAACPTKASPAAWPRW